MLKHFKIIVGAALFFAYSNGFAETKKDSTQTAGTTAAASGAADWKGDAAHGQALFEQCKACHQLDKRGVGPALRGVNDRRDVAWLTKWIKNPAAVIAAGDEYAVKLKSEYGGVMMSPFGTLSDQDIKDILQYIKDAPKPKPVITDNVKTKEVANNFYIILTLVLLLLISLYILNKVKANLRAAEMAKEGNYSEAPKSAPWYIKLIPAKVRARNPIVMGLFAFAILALLFTGWFFKFSITEVGVQKGYAPEQPIAFSHKIHAGDNGIDCKYCHSTAESSKQASIPAINTCMNCHKGISSMTDNAELTKEIEKLYKYADFNEGKFGTNQKPVRWIRIHNLPDHAYFNHSQHVKVGKIECQTCHGPIEKMEKVQQWNTLQMGWCIDCHRTRGIDAENNKYYSDLHAHAKEDLKNKGDKSKYFNAEGKITPAMNGGLECSKCHY